MTRLTHTNLKTSEDQGGSSKQVNKRHPDETSRLLRLANRLDPVKVFGYKVNNKTFLIKAINSVEATDLGRKIAYKNAAPIRIDSKNLG